MQMCFVCETPFQLLNCINFTINSANQRKDKVDLYIGEMFINYEEVVRNIQRKHIFRNVYTYSYKRALNTKIINRHDTVLNPKRYLEKILTEKEIIDTYDAIFISVITRIAIALVLVNKQATVSYYDDGLGSYRGDISGYNVSIKLRLLLYIRGAGKRFFKPEALYVNNSSMCRSNIKAEIRELPELRKRSSQFILLLHDIFGQTNPIYEENRLIFLSQPLDERENKKIEDYINISEMVGKSISKYNFVYRPHPRDKKIVGFPKNVDDRGGLWELVCEEYISDNSILIGNFSTAQYIPKILFNLEPFIIFTFPLYKKCFSFDTIKQFENEVDRLKSRYQEPSKIFTVNNYDELDRILKQLMQGKETNEQIGCKNNR